MSKEIAMPYIDSIAPDHARTGCEEFEPHNAAFIIDGVLYNKCERCTLIRIAQLASGEIEPAEDEE